MRPIDLRSDTVTRPTPGMLRAMARAEMGDDGFGEDPTVRRLEEEVAALLGQEAGLFVPSGTMGNQIALQLWTTPGEEVLLDAEAHILHYEGGAPERYAGVRLRPIPAPRGLIRAEQLSVRGEADWEARTRLLCLENTHNRGGGAVYPVQLFRETVERARALGLRVHLDGARLWNAHVATGEPPQAWARLVDSVMVSFSKGLGAPAGSLLCASEEAIQEARRIRKRMGGGMRQVGLLAAAALYALRNGHLEMLRADHEKARRLAEGLAEFPGLHVAVQTVQTNIVLIELLDQPAEAFVRKLAAVGVWMVPFGPACVRAVTHRDVSMHDIEEALRRIRRIRI
ncbi:MAG: beta-eliminating lyase-related protein [Bacteroidetes bacterium]|nr:beta-eliminating lyase-related protein [Rhodothermia bacterium]MCX7906502.1 beta-eliminating lyase-related protein [Bacteroidota bacterium]MDW8284913.1 GntG family PLP-dependent aldolase [Bacteroidota bacterium]